MNGVELIAKERQRQIDGEDGKFEPFDANHDAEHTRDELAYAAVCYIKANRADLPRFLGVPLDWPWEFASWHPSDDRVRNLVKAGALIAAEIDRLQRKADA